MCNTYRVSQKFLKFLSSDSKLKNASLSTNLYYKFSGKEYYLEIKEVVENLRRFAPQSLKMELKIVHERCQRFGRNLRNCKTNLFSIHNALSADISSILACAVTRFISTWLLSMGWSSVKGLPLSEALKPWRTEATNLFCSFADYDRNDDSGHWQFSNSSSSSLGAKRRTFSTLSLISSQYSFPEILKYIYNIKKNVDLLIMMHF